MKNTSIHKNQKKQKNKQTLEQKKHLIYQGNTSRIPCKLLFCHLKDRVHKMWMFLNSNYTELSQKQKNGNKHKTVTGIMK